VPVEKQTIPVEEPRFLARNAATVIATSSVLVAMCAFVVAVRSLYLEMEYKELSIRPAVTLTVSNATYQYTWKSSGLGPARITRVIVATPSGCLDSNKLSASEWNERTNRFINDYANETFNAFRVGGNWSGLRINAGIPHEDINIRPGDIQTIVSLHPEDVALLDKELTRLGDEGVKKYYANFLKRMESLPIAFEYESMTGKFKDRAEPIDQSKVGDCLKLFKK
jgi:hypothetical protein